MIRDIMRQLKKGIYSVMPICVKRQLEPWFMMFSKWLLLKYPRFFHKKVYLFAGDYKTDRFAKLCQEYMRATFAMKDIVLFVMVEDRWASYAYIRRHTSIPYSRVGQIVCIDKHATSVKDMLRRVQCYITDEADDADLGLVDQAYRQGLKICPMRRTDIFEDLRPDDEALDVRKKLKAQAEKFFMQYPVKEYQYIFFHQGLGETCCLFYMLKDYRQSIQKDIVALACDASRFSVIEECPYVEGKELVSADLFAYLLVFMAGKYPLLNPGALHFFPHTLKYHLRPMEYGGSMIGAVRDFLRLPEAYTLKKYHFHIPERKSNDASQCFNKLGLKKHHTVFLIMDGLSLGNEWYTRDEILRLVKAIQNAGYDVVLKSNQEVLPGVPCVLLHPMESAVFAGLCGNIITIPTGLPDAIGSFTPGKGLGLQYLFKPSYVTIWHNSEDVWYIDNLPLIKYNGNDFVRVLGSVLDAYQKPLWEDAFVVKRYVAEHLEETLIRQLVANLV